MTPSLRYMLLSRIDYISFSVDHATVLEQIIRGSTEIREVRSNCVTRTILNDLVESYFGPKKELLLVVPEGFPIEKYLHRVNTTIWVCAIKKDKKWFGSVLQELISILESRLYGALLPSLTTELRGRTYLIRVLVGISLLKILYPTRGVLALWDLLKEIGGVPRVGTILDAPNLEKYFSEPTLCKTWEEYLLREVFRGTISSTSLSLLLKRQNIVEICNDIWKFSQEGVDCVDSVGYDKMVDFVMKTTSYPTVYRIWSKFADVWVQLTQQIL